jgi:hypothetical protein
VSAAAPDAGVGEAPVDPAKGGKGRRKRLLDRRAISDVAGPRFDGRAEARKAPRAELTLLAPR